MKYNLSLQLGIDQLCSAAVCCHILYKTQTLLRLTVRHKHSSTKLPECLKKGLSNKETQEDNFHTDSPNSLHNLYIFRSHNPKKHTAALPVAVFGHADVCIGFTRWICLPTLPGRRERKRPCSMWNPNAQIVATG